MHDSREKLRDFIQNPVDTLKELHAEYGLDQKELSKIMIITSTALLVVSIHAASTMGSVQQDLEQTDQEVQEASAVINSESFQSAMDSLSRVQSDRITRQLEAARTAFQSADQSFQKISEAEQKVDKSRRTYQWMSLISILGIVSGVALRFM